MTFTLSPEILVSKYIKSATGRTMHPTDRRVLTLIVVPLLVGAIVFGCSMFYDGIVAVNTTKRLNTALKDENLHNSHTEYNYGKTKIVHDSPYYTLWEQQLAEAEDSVDLVYYSPLFLLGVILIPWIILRLLFWIIDAKQEEVNTT